MPAEFTELLNTSIGSMSIGNICSAIITLVICLFGLVLIWSGCQAHPKVIPSRVMKVQVIGITVGFVGLIILSLIDFERFPWLWVPVAVLNVAFQLVLAVPGVGKEVGGNVSWIELPGGLNIQPGEVGKVIFIYTMACHMSWLREKLNAFWSVAQLVAHMGITMGSVLLAFGASAGIGVIFGYLPAVLLPATSPFPEVSLPLSLLKTQLLPEKNNFHVPLKMYIHCHQRHNQNSGTSAFPYSHEKKVFFHDEMGNMQNKNFLSSLNEHNY